MEDAVRYPEDVFYADCPIRSLTPFIGTSYAIEDGSVMVFPGAWIHAEIDVPQELRHDTSVSVHSRSTFARLGLDMCIDQTEFQRIIFKKEPLTTIRVTIINEGLWPVVVREGDTVAVASRSRLFQLAVERMYLHAGNTRIEIIEENLPSFEIPDFGMIRYIDPSRVKSSEYTRTVSFDTLHVHVGDYVVMSVKESVTLLPNRIGMVVPATDNLIFFNSSVFAYPGWSGYLAIEFKAHQEIEIMPGMHLAYLLLFQHYRPLIPYSGKYNRQEQQSIEPR